MTGGPYLTSWVSPKITDKIHQNKHLQMCRNFCLHANVQVKKNNQQISKKIKLKSLPCLCPFYI